MAEAGLTAVGLRLENVAAAAGLLGRAVAVERRPRRGRPSGRASPPGRAARRGRRAGQEADLLPRRGHGRPDRRGAGRAVFGAALSRAGGRDPAVDRGLPLAGSPRRLVPPAVDCQARAAQGGRQDPGRRRAAQRRPSSARPWAAIAACGRRRRRRTCCWSSAARRRACASRATRSWPIRRGRGRRCSPASRPGWWPCSRSTAP